GRVCRPRVLRVPENTVPAWGRDRELAAMPRMRLEERILVGDDVAHYRERFRHERPRGGGPDARRAAVGLFPERPPSGVGGEGLLPRTRRVCNAFLAQGNRDHPRVASELPVGDDLDSRGLLQRDGLPHGTVLDDAKLAPAHRAVAHALAGLLEKRGPQ